MAIFNTKTYTDMFTGGKDTNIGEYNRQKLLWSGRAEVKRLSSRIDALESNQKKLSSGVSNGNQGGELGPIPEIQKAVESKQLNPLNVKNITISQVYAGDSKKDILFAQKTSEKNTKLLKEFTKSTKEIAQNTKKVIKQDTKIKKKDTILAKSKEKFNDAKKIALDSAKKTEGTLGNFWTTIKELLPGVLAMGILGIAKSLLYKVFGLGKHIVKKLLGGGVKALTKKITAPVQSAKKLWGQAKNAPKNLWEKGKNKAKNVKNSVLDKFGFNKKENKKFNKNNESLSVKARLRKLEIKLAMCCADDGDRKRRKRRKRGRTGRVGRNMIDIKNQNIKNTAKPIGTTKTTISKSSHKGGKLSKAKNIIKGVASKAGGWLSWLFKGLKKFGWPILRGILLVVVGVATGGLGAIVLLVMEAIFTAWLVYDVIKFSAEALGIDQGIFDRFEKWLSGAWTAIKSVTLDKIAELAKNAAIKAGKAVVDFGKAVGNRATDARVILFGGTAEEKAVTTANLNIYKVTNKIEEVREKLQTATGSEARSLRKELLRLDTLYTRHCKAAGYSGEGLKYVSSITLIGFDFWTTDEEIAEAKQIYLSQLQMARDESKGGNIKRNTIIDKTSITTSVKMKTGSSSGKKLKKSSDFNVGTSSGSESSSKAQFGSKVNGLWPAAWNGMTIDEGYRKVIDYIENGNTGNYALKGNRSSAYGRYQFMPATAIEYSAKARIIGDWKEPINQDIMFQKLTEDNIKRIKQKGIEPNIMSTWIAHNLGAGAVAYMMGKTDKPWSSDAKRNINNQLPGNGGSTVEEAKKLYLAKYSDIIDKVIGGAVSNPMTDVKTGNVTSFSSGSTAGTASSGSGASISGGPNLSNMSIAGTTPFSKGGGLASAAGQYVGKISYVYGAGREGNGVRMNGAGSYDCSSFVALVVQKELGIAPNVFGGTVFYQYSYMTNPSNAMRVVDEKTAQSGDIIFFWYEDKAAPSHVGIVTGYNSMIHNSSKAGGVISAKWGKGKRPRQIFRFKTAGATSSNITTGSPSAFSQEAVYGGSAAAALNSVSSPVTSTNIEQKVAAGIVAGVEAVSNPTFQGAGGKFPGESGEISLGQASCLTP